MENKRKALVVGPSLGNKLGGVGWIKHNICKALESEFDVTSVYMDPGNKSTTNSEEIVSNEERSSETYTIWETCVRSVPEWSNFLDVIKPDLVVAIGDVETVWYVPIEAKEKKFKTIYYFISEAHTVNRYIETVDQEGGVRYLDLVKPLKMFDHIVPCTAMTLFGMEKDLGLEYTNAPEIITPPVWKWEIDKDKGWEYRKDINIDFDCKLFFTIARNNERKRLDQLLILFKEKLLKKPCYRLVIHTNEDAKLGYDLIAINARLGISGNVVINYKKGKRVMEGLFSAADTYIGTPAAEGYGLPFHEALAVGKECIHTTVGQPNETAKMISDRKIQLVSATVPYFYRKGNQLWYAMDPDPKIKRYGKSGKYKFKEVINTPEQFNEKFIKTVEGVIG